MHNFNDGHPAKKHKDHKVDLSLLPPMPLVEIAKVYMYGVREYGRWNWARGLSYSDLFAAALRHSWKWFWGENYDFDSNIHHLAHAAWYLLTLIQFSFGEVYRKFDDRPIGPAMMCDDSLGNLMHYEIPEHTLERWAKRDKEKCCG